MASVVVGVKIEPILTPVSALVEPIKQYVLVEPPLGVPHTKYVWPAVNSNISKNACPVEGVSFAV